MNLIIIFLVAYCASFSTAQHYGSNRLGLLGTPIKFSLDSFLPSKSYNGAYTSPYLNHHYDAKKQPAYTTYSNPDSYKDEDHLEYNPIYNEYHREYKEDYKPAYKYDYDREYKEEYKPVYNDDYHREYKNDYKPAYKYDYDREYKEEYKPAYKADYPSNYKPAYKADYPSDYKPAYKNDYPSDYKPTYNYDYHSKYKPVYKGDYSPQYKPNDPYKAPAPKSYMTPDYEVYKPRERTSYQADYKANQKYEYPLGNAYDKSYTEKQTLYPKAYNDDDKYSNYRKEPSYGTGKYGMGRADDYKQSIYKGDDVYAKGYGSSY